MVILSQFVQGDHEQPKPTWARCVGYSVMKSAINYASNRTMTDEIGRNRTGSSDFTSFSAMVGEMKPISQSNFELVKCLDLPNYAVNGRNRTMTDKEVAD